MKIFQNAIKAFQNYNITMFEVLILKILNSQDVNSKIMLQKSDFNYRHWIL